MWRARRLMLLLATVGALGACAGPVPTRESRPSSAPATAPIAPTPTPLPSRIVHTGHAPVETGEPIELADLSGRIVFDDFEDVFAMDVDGSDVVKVAAEPGSEFDGAWSPDGKWVVYRDSTRGINENDEIFVAAADGSERRNITNDPANDWGPDWSPDGSTIVFNSDRDGGRLRGYLVDPDGSNLRRLDIDAWVEYPSFSPDGTKIVFEGHDGSDYEVYVADIATGETLQLTDNPGGDGWPVVVARRIDDRLHLGARRLRVPALDSGVLADRRAQRRASRRLGHEPRRLRPAPRHRRDRPVRCLVTRRPLPPGLGSCPVRGPARRDGPAGAARRRHRPSARRHPGLALNPQIRGRTSRRIP